MLRDAEISLDTKPKRVCLTRADNWPFRDTFATALSHRETRDRADFDALFETHIAKRVRFASSVTTLGYRPTAPSTQFVNPVFGTSNWVGLATAGAPVAAAYHATTGAPAAVASTPPGTVHGILKRPAACPDLPDSTDSSSLPKPCKKGRGPDRCGQRELLPVACAPDPKRREWEDPFGHLLVQSGDITGCLKCGACATFGSVGKYLRGRCQGPVSSALKRQRDSLRQGAHPATGKRLAQSFVRVAATPQ